jgi:hypothetical protein
VVPGPGAYDPVLPSLKQNFQKFDDQGNEILPVARHISPNILTKLRLADEMLGNKAVAFSTQAERFPAKTDRVGRNMAHKRSNTINGEEDALRPVYEL